MTSFPRELIAAVVLVLAVGAALPPAAQEAPPARPEEAPPSTNPFAYTSPDEEFTVVFPSGCSKLVSRANEPDLYEGQRLDETILVQFVTCDRYEEKGEGCSVRATLNWHDRQGNPGDPSLVIKQVEETLETFGVQVVNQNPVRKDFGKNRVIEGVDVQAANPGHEGEVWIRGLLIGGDVFILTAWNLQGGLWNNPEYQAFFDSFQPFVE
jgi:hypothetical protein